MNSILHLEYKQERKEDNCPVLLVDVPRHKNLTGVLCGKRSLTQAVGFMKDGAQWLVDNTDIKLVGIDYLSIDAYEDLIHVHLVFLKSREIIVVEALKLDDTEAGIYTVHCLTLRILGAEGSPVSRKHQIYLGVEIKHHTSGPNYRRKGPVLVVDTPRDKNITAEVMRSLNIPRGVKRVLFRTLNTDSRVFGQNTDIKLVGVDYLSVAINPKDGLVKVHQLLLDPKDIIPVEGLKLDDAVPGVYTIHCLPLRLVHGDGSPARCILFQYDVKTAGTSHGKRRSSKPQPVS
ncbi:hypothetical protein K7X08_038049 [Anisodus acutangulus]|uniref:Uncharacterized protein n=1 Tax=Anisodus acutangulus TaxID=402998 RepID=A0A9Q1RPY9_9SOLA|nr:hypothetical protein K7X08_038049 [Anisodus acutangulus]